MKTEKRLKQLVRYVSKKIGGSQSEWLKIEIKSMSDADAVKKCENLIMLNCGGKMPAELDQDAAANGWDCSK